MNKIIDTILITLVMAPLTYAQPMFLVEGSLEVGFTEEADPSAGTIRWNGFDLEGYNGYEWLSLISGQSGPLSDNDGNEYQTVRIGELVWMAENLRTSKFADGTMIPQVTDDMEWDALTSAAYCWFDNNSSYDPTVGKLYNWYAVETEQLCPVGWRMPTDTDFNNLIEFLGGSSEAGSKLKETGIVHWDTPNVATNESGFTALPNGGRVYQGAFSQLFGKSAHFWSSSEHDSAKAWYLYLSNISAKTIFTNSQKKYGFAVRCVK